MSEYQYYEFRAVDRPLDQGEMDALRRLSTRAEITPTSFTNTYHWGDFKGKPETLMERYFDAFVYVANWGSHRLMLRIPASLLDAEAAGVYCDGEVLSITAAEGHVVLNFSSEDESGGEWSEGDGWMSSLITLRAELMRGDLRALYLGWLASLPWPGNYEDDDVEEFEKLEPPVPPGLGKLSASLKELAEFLRVDDDLIEVAAEGSTGEPATEASRDDLARWIKGLPGADKDAFLLRFLAEEGDLVLRAELSKRFREANAPAPAPSSRRKKRSPGGEGGRRTIAQLLKARDAMAAEKQRKAAEEAANLKSLRDREKAEARATYLDELARREPATWREVEQLIDTKRQADYDRAVTLLVDLRDLAVRSGRASEAELRIGALRKKHGNKPSLITRFDKQRLGKSV